MSCFSFSLQLTSMDRSIISTVLSFPKNECLSRNGVKCTARSRSEWLSCPEDASLPKPPVDERELVDRARENPASYVACEYPCLCVCEYPCLRVCEYPCLRVCEYPCLCVCEYPCLCVCAYPCLCVCAYPCLCVREYPCLCVCEYPCLCACAYPCLCVRDNLWFRVFRVYS